MMAWLAVAAGVFLPVLWTVVRCGERQGALVCRRLRWHRGWHIHGRGRRRAWFGPLRPTRLKRQWTGDRVFGPTVIRSPTVPEFPDTPERKETEPP
jgi:hypothetical protein